jgi:hypothetical protein
MGKRQLDHVFKIIKKVREPGEPPSQSSKSFDLFECDLCKGDIEKSKLTQCPYCGRWICKENCWNTKNLACTSCTSVIKLADKQEDKSYSESQEQTKKQEKTEDTENFIKRIKKKILK